MPAFAIIVPCRLESTRFPRKLLHPIKGKPLVLWVAERITAQAPDYPLWFAVDHQLLADCLEGAGFRAIMTDAGHQSGTDRIAEANRTATQLQAGEGDLDWVLQNLPDAYRRLIRIGTYGSFFQMYV